MMGPKEQFAVGGEAMTAYPVAFDIQRPEKFDRVQVALRLAVLLVLSILAGAMGWVFGLLYLAIPIWAAILISQKGAETYLAERGGSMLTLLRWYLALYAYLYLLTDRFPTEKPEDAIRFEVEPSGSPTVGSALLRLIMSIPSAFVLGILGIVGFFILIIAVISVLIQESYPEGLWNFQLAISRWHARLLGYHSSLVGEYPPFAIDTGPEEAPATGVDQPSAPAPEGPTEA
jgi:hypothetical protein